MKKKQHKVSLNEATDNVVSAYDVREFEIGGEIPKRIGANELLITIRGEVFLIKVTRHETNPNV